jgi:hypothetical protein
VSDTDDFEEYWAVVRPVRHPPPAPLKTPTLETALEGIEFWVSILDDQDREQTPRIRVGALTGTFNFPPLPGPTHIARIALWSSETAEEPSQQVTLELGVNLLAGDTPSVSYNLNFEEPFTRIPIRGFQSSS